MGAGGLARGHHHDEHGRNPHVQLEESTMRLASQRRPGKVVVLVALLLTGLVGVAAIAVDGGLLQDERRRAQAAADAAAMAAAEDLYTNYLTYYGVDTPTKTAYHSALDNAAANG